MGHSVKTLAYLGLAVAAAGIYANSAAHWVHLFMGFFYAIFFCATLNADDR